MSESVQKNKMDAGTIVAAAVIISAIGALFYNVLPMYLGAAQDHRGLGNEQIGFIGTSFFLGFTLASSSAFFWIRRIDWRVVSYLAIAVAALGLLIAGGSGGYVNLLVGVFVAGCGCASIYSVGTTLISDTSNAARWYGAKITAEAALGVVLLVVAPTLILPRWGFAGLNGTLIVTILVLAPVVMFLPPQGSRRQEKDAVRPVKGNTGPVSFALLACVLFICGQTAIWGFVERIGNSAGFNPALVGALLGVSLAFAGAGALLAAWIGDRVGCLKPLIWAHLCFFTGVAVLFRGSVFEMYAVATCLIMFSVGLGIAYAVSTIAELDDDGRYVVLSVPALGVGVMIGPGAAGLLASGTGYGPVLVFGLATLSASLLIFVLAHRSRRADSVHLARNASED